MPAEPTAHRSSALLKAFVAAVVATGAALIVESTLQFDPSTLTVYLVILSALTIATGRFAIKVPGQPATVSVSVVFVFASILLAGPAVPVLTVVLDGLWTSFRQRNRRLYRAAFNIAEPALSTWASAHVFFILAGVAPGAFGQQTAAIVPATIAMAATFFGLNSGLNALAVALESGTSAFHVWRSHALYLAVNYYAAASLAAFAVATASTINYGVVGLAAPLVILSYVAYREASVRADESRQHVTDIEGLYRASVEMLAIAVDAKDQITHGHIRRVQRHTLAIARSLGVDDPRDLKAIEAGALLHDIGKLAVPDYVLNKPSALTPVEFETMKKHATMGARILTAVSFPYPIVPIVRHHHERWDGRGYPDGLCGSEIPLGARILAVVDCFDALTSDRPYRPKLSEDEAVEILRSRTGTFYDPRVVARFIELIPELRRDDLLTHDHKDVHASVVAGLVQPSGSSARQHDAVMHAAVGEQIPAHSCDRIEQFVRRQSGCEACVFVPDSQGDSLLVAYATPGLRHAIAGMQIAVGTAVSGWVAANRSTIRKADAALDLGELAERFTFKDCVSVPLFVCGDLFGVLTVYGRTLPASEETTAAVGLLAQEVGILIAKNRWVSRAAASRSSDSFAAVS